MIASVASNCSTGSGSRSAHSCVCCCFTLPGTNVDRLRETGRDWKRLGGTWRGWSNKSGIEFVSSSQPILCFSEKYQKLRSGPMQAPSMHLHVQLFQVSCWSRRVWRDLQTKNVSRDRVNIYIYIQYMCNYYICTWCVSKCMYIDKICLCVHIYESIYIYIFRTNACTWIKM